VFRQYFINNDIQYLYLSSGFHFCSIHFKKHTNVITRIPVGAINDPDTTRNHTWELLTLIHGTTRKVKSFSRSLMAPTGILVITLVCFLKCMLQKWNPDERYRYCMSLLIKYWRNTYYIWLLNISINYYLTLLLSLTFPCKTIKRYYCFRWRQPIICCRELNSLSDINQILKL
jgi:hypothetical protein